MKLASLLAIVFAAFTAQAGVWYVCDGITDEESQASIDLVFQSADKVEITDMDGDEISLDFAESTKGNQIFGNYEYDGYGGFVELRVPKSFRLGQTNSFPVDYNHEIYSEIGHVGNVGFKGTCVPGVTK